MWCPCHGSRRSRGVSGATEAVVCHALELQGHGRHLLLAGDPVAAGEVLAAPSADRLDAIAVCLLDVDTDAQAARLVARGDDPALVVHHVAFAGWMRRHAADPHHRPEVLQTGGWEQMRWDRWSRLGDKGGWAMHVLDTSANLRANAGQRKWRRWRPRPSPTCTTQFWSASWSIGPQEQP